MNQTQWDAFILARSPGALFQSWEWGEVTKKLGHKIWRLEWPDGIAQVEKVPARRGTFLHVRHGPIGEINFNDLKALAKKEHAWFIRVSPQIQDDSTLKKLGFVPAPIHAMDAELCWVLDLASSEEELLAGMRKTTRYEIRRGQKMGIEILKSINSKDLRMFFDLYDKTSSRHGFVQHTGIREEFEVFSKNKNAVLYVASFEGKVIAAAIVLYFGDEAIYHHGASVPSKIPGSYLIQWEAIREAKRLGMKLYNFWGIAPEDNQNHPWQGLTAFKTGFGGREERFIHAMDFPISPFYIIPKTIERIRRRIKGY